MRLINANRPIDVSEIGSQTDLVANVMNLVACLSEAFQDPTNQSFEDFQQQASLAMASARFAEDKLSQCRERIAFLERLATTDEMTGLKNRRGFETMLEQTLAQAARYDEHGILAYIDLDDFKPINDTLGHAAGDAVLCHVAHLLQENVRGADFVGRLGGDEFGLVLVRSDWEPGLTRIEALDRLLNSARLTWGSKIVRLKASIGVQAYGPEHSAPELMSQADDAMYRTKRYRTTLATNAELRRRGFGQ